MQHIHGHEVMELMLAQDRAWTRPELVEAIVARFGADARFHTCSAQGMSPDELLDFLGARGKFVESEDGIRTERSRICNH